MDYSKYRNKYLNILSNWKNNIPEWKAFEYAVALKHSMIVWSDIPPNFGEIYKLPHLMDYGIDCINLEYNKTLQVKHYNKSNITWKIMSTYIAYSLYVLGISDMNLITTPTANISSMACRSFPNLLRYTLDELTESLPDPPVFEKPVFEKRQYQTDCVNLFLQSDQSIMRFELPCGVGKSYIIYEIILQSPDKKHVLFVPWTDLANQMMTQLESFNIKAKLMGDGCHVDNIDNIQVLVCITASAKKLAKMDFSFDYKFIDEAHHVEKMESKQLEYINEIESERELHLSATFRKIHPLDYCMSLRDAIDGGWLSDYRIYIEYFTKGEMFDNVVQLVKTNPDWFPMFVYFNTTERAIEFAKQVGCEYLIGTCSKSKRARIVDDLNNYKLPILSLCGCFNEGISINNLATIVFGNYRFSKINRIQIAMRASRLHPNKPFSRLVFPICKGGFEDKDLQAMLKSFGEIDYKLSESMRNNGTRISITSRNEKAELVPAEFICEKIYNRFGELIGKLTIEEKIDEFLRWIETHNCVPKQNCLDKFSDGTKITGFWEYCKHRNKFLEILYTKLLSNEIIKKYYDEYLERKNLKITLPEKLTILLNYVEKNNKTPPIKGKDLFPNKQKIGLFWDTIKIYKKIEEPKYSILLQNKIIIDAYNEYWDRLNMIGKKKKLDNDIKILLLLEWVSKNNKLPPAKCKDLFPDGQKIGIFWDTCKHKKKLNNDPFNKLLSNDIITKAYNDHITFTKIKIDNEEIISSFINYVNNNGLPTHNCKIKFRNNRKLIGFWNNCKRYGSKLHKQPYIKLLNNKIIKDDYINFIQNSRKNEWLKYTRVNKFLDYVNRKGIPNNQSKVKFKGDITLYEFWDDIKQNKKCIEWPYIELLNNQLLNDDYSLICK